MVQEDSPPATGFGQVRGGADGPTCPAGPRALTGLRCDRVHYAAGHGSVSPSARASPIEYAMTFGADLRVTHQIALNGLPSRTRVSSDGRFGAATVFVTGHSYSGERLLHQHDPRRHGRRHRLANLEDFTVLRDGAPFNPADTNIWGVTFAPDSNRFVATLATGGKTYLVDGDIGAADAGGGPGERRVPIAFARRHGHRLQEAARQWQWRPGLAFPRARSGTGKETPLAEARSVDDQLEWLDDNTVATAAPTPARPCSPSRDGTGQPRQLLGEALSPAVVRAPLTRPSPPVPPRRRRRCRSPSTAPPTATAGGTITQTITVTNTGSVDATRLVVDDTLTGPAKATSATATTPPGASGFGCTVLSEENRARCDVSGLAAGATWEVTITVTPTGPGAVVGNVIASAAEITSESGPTTATTTTSVS